MNEYWIHEEKGAFPNTATTPRGSKFRTKTAGSYLSDEHPAGEVNACRRRLEKEAWEPSSERWPQSCYGRRTKVWSQQPTPSTLLLFSKTLTSLSGAIKLSRWSYYPRVTRSRSFHHIPECDTFLTLGSTCFPSSPCDPQEGNMLTRPRVWLLPCVSNSFPPSSLCRRLFLHLQVQGLPPERGPPSPSPFPKSDPTTTTANLPSVIS